jgi:DNA-binding MarR family transcriptional regulator
MLRRTPLHRILDDMRVSSIALLGTSQFGSHARDLVLLMALAGGSLTPHKASEVCGIPRGTVARRLKRLAAKGLVQLGPDGRYRIAPKAMRRLEG